MESDRLSAQASTRHFLFFLVFNVGTLQYLLNPYKFTTTLLASQRFIFSYTQHVILSYNNVIHLCFIYFQLGDGHVWSY